MCVLLVMLCFQRQMVSLTKRQTADLAMLILSLGVTEITRQCIRGPDDGLHICRGGKVDILDMGC